MSMRATVDAVALAAKIRDELPSGSAQHYAAMVILNSLMSYSEQYGLLLEPEDHTVVTSLSVEYLYLAWYYGVEIKLNQSQTKYWPHQVWKDSASIGINLKEMVEARETTDHDKLRNARTLLSFGAVVNRYFGVIRGKKNGLETFKNSYCPVVPGLSPILPSDTPTSQFKPVKLGWRWTNLWGRSSPQPAETKPPSPAIEPLLVPGSMPPPPVVLLPFSAWDTPLEMESLPSVSASTESTISTSFLPDSTSPTSTWTAESIADSTVSAMDRLEAYLSVIGTPGCENVGVMPVKRERLVTLEEAEKAAGDCALLEPVRKMRGELRIGPVVAGQQEARSQSTSNTCAVRWMSREELKVRQDKVDAQKLQQKVKELKKMKWKGAKSAQLMPRRAALVQFQPGVGSSPLANEVMSESRVIQVDFD